MRGNLAFQICVVIASLCVQPGPAAAAGIATVVDVINEGYRTPPGAAEVVAKSTDELVQNEVLRTEKESAIQVRFVDGSELSVEQSSEMVLSDYLFDGSASTGVIDLNAGLFHFTSNGQPDQGLKLRTPVATIGIRGTEFLVHVDQDNATVIDILTGTVEATPLGTGKPVTCYEGQSILIASRDDDGLCGDIGSFATAAAPPQSKEENRGAHDGTDRERKAREPKSQERAHDAGGGGSTDGGGDSGGGDGGDPGGGGEPDTRG